MTPTERLKKVVAGEYLDRPAAAFWGPHLNIEEMNAHDISYAMIANEQAYNWDFVKFDFSGMYFPEAFGQKITFPYHEGIQAWLNVEKWVINHPSDWLKLKPLQVKDSEVFMRNVEAIKRTTDYFQGSVPVLPTVFSPVSMAGEFVAGYFDQDKLIRMFEENEKEVAYGLSVIEETLVNIMEAYVAAGADGFFVGLQNGLNAGLGYDLFKKYEFDGTSRIVNAIKDKTWFNMAHLCNGLNTPADKDAVMWCKDLPVTALNWADTWEYAPSLAEMREAAPDKVLVGGIMHINAPLTRAHMNGVGVKNDFQGDRETVKATLRKRVDDAIAAAGNKLVIAGGCGCYQPHHWPVFSEVMDEVEAERKAARQQR